MRECCYFQGIEVGHRVRTSNIQPHKIKRKEIMKKLLVIVLFAFVSSCWTGAFQQDEKEDALLKLLPKSILSF